MENKKIIYRLKQEKLSAFVPMEIEYEDTPKHRLRTQSGVMIGYLQEGEYTSHHHLFDKMMADTTIEKVFVKTTVFNKDESKLIERQYIFIPYINTEHPYFKEPILSSVPADKNYLYTVVLSYIDDSCSDDPVFVHLPVTVNATESITDIIDKISWSSETSLNEYWTEVRDDSSDDSDDEDDEDDDHNIMERGVPFFNEAGESFLCHDFEQNNLIAFKVVDIKRIADQK